MLVRLSAKTVSVTTEGPERRIKEMAISPLPLITAPRFLSPSPFPSPLFDLRPLLCTGSFQMARRPHAGVDLGRFTVDVTTLARTVACCIPPLLPSPPLIRLLRRHITAERLLCLSRGAGGRSVAGVDTNAYFSSQSSPYSTSPSSTHSKHGGMDKPC
jgi:hypothetical protein